MTIRKTIRRVVFLSFLTMLLFTFQTSFAVSPDLRATSEGGSCPAQGLPEPLDEAWDAHNPYAYSWLIDQRDACLAAGNEDAAELVDQLLYSGAKAIALHECPHSGSGDRLEEVLRYLRESSSERWFHDLSVFAFGGAAVGAVIVVTEVALCLCCISGMNQGKRGN